MKTERRLKLLYVDVEASFINPTRNLVPALLRQIGDVRFFGPGYVTRPTLDEGLENFIQREGPFDFLLTNTHILYADRSEPIPEGYRRSYATSCPFDELASLNDICDALSSIKIPKIALMWENDFYHSSDEAIQRLDQNVDFIVGLGSELYPKLDELKNLALESWGMRANDNWANFVDCNRSRIISMPMYVSEAEFSERQLPYRDAVWAVLGSHYVARTAAIAALSAAKIPVDSRTPLFVLQLIRQRLHLFRRETVFLQRIVNLLFWMKLARSRYAYTCGSGLEIPVRKFFEIPAAGGLMACSPCKGFGALGFRDGVNAIVCEPQDLPALHRELEMRPEYAQSIAQAGQRLVAERHTVSARARDLRRVLAHIMAGTFGGSRWCDGQFEISRA
jgi:hypothetical protein